MLPAQLCFPLIPHSTFRDQNKSSSTTAAAATTTTATQATVKKSAVGIGVLEHGGGGGGVLEPKAGKDVNIQSAVTPMPKAV